MTDGQRRDERGPPRPVDETRRVERERRQRERAGDAPPRVRDDPAPPRPVRVPESVRPPSPSRPADRRRGRPPPSRPPPSSRVPSAVRPAPPVWNATTPAARTFDVDGATWEASAAGGGVYGTGPHSLAPLVAVRFRPRGAASPTREALLPAGAFEAMHDEELRDLLARATPLAGPADPGRDDGGGR